MRWRRVPPVFSPAPARALLDGALASIGLRADCRAFVEDALRRRYQSHDAILTDSGTSALLVVLQRFLPRTATVALPSYSCIDLTAAAVAAGVKVRLYDLDPTTLSPDLDSVRSVIARGVDAIVVAHLYGYPADVPGVQAIAAASGTLVIEDAAQGAGGSLAGRLLGSAGDVAILSFGRGKGTTAGAGGAILFNSDLHATRAAEVRHALQPPSRGGANVVKLVAQDILSRPLLYSLPASIPMLQLGEMVYHPAGTPRMMSQASTAILSRTLAGVDLEVESRRGRAAKLLSEISGLPNIVPARPIAIGSSGYLRLAVLDAGGGLEPRADLGALRGYPLTLDQHPQLQAALRPGERAGRGSQYLRDRLFTLPTHARSHVGYVTDVADWLRGARQSLSAVPVFS